VRLRLVQREPGATDRRIVVIGLTESGRALLGRVQSDKRARLEQILQRMAEDDRDTFFRLIEEYLDAGRQTAAI
jgi:DNA-binding MarR family transcriptional regulator